MNRSLRASLFVAALLPLALIARAQEDPPQTEVAPENSPEPAHVGGVTLGAGDHVARPGTQAPPSSSGGGVDDNSGGGISCDKTEPRLSGGVVKREFALVPGGVLWEVPPNGAISYHFKTPASGTGSFISVPSNPNARPEPFLTSVSETPCDFNYKKAGKDLCYSWDTGGDTGGVIFRIASGSNSKACTLKPNTDYFLNVRTLTNPAREAAPRDSCAVDAFRPARCGGLWHFKSY